MRTAKHISLELLEEPIVESVVVMCGSVDASKSTLIGILSNPNLRSGLQDLNKYLDDGNGKARSLIMRTPHERESGRTSTVTYIPIYFNKNIWDIPTNKTITILDLCGHSAYLKTTINGVCSNTCAFGIVCIDKATKSLNPMTIEHMKLLDILEIPYLILITKIDKREETEIKKTLGLVRKRITTNKKLMILKDKDTQKDIDMNLFVPVILISCKTGYGIKRLMHFMANTNPMPKKKEERPIFVIDATFNVIGHGIVVSGNSYIDINVSDKLLIGPSVNGTFSEVSVRTIHDDYMNNIPILHAGRRGCLNIKGRELTKKNISPGMILFYKSWKPSYANKLVAEIKVLKGTNITIKTNFSPICYIGPIRIPARFELLDKEVARSEDTIHVKIHADKFIAPNIHEKVIFRDGGIVGYGIIQELLT